MCPIGNRAVILSFSRRVFQAAIRSCRMCGIVGLLVKNPALRNQLGALMVPMLVGMTERGPDSAGLAVYTAPVSERHHKLSLYSGENAVDWSELLAHDRRRLRACARDLDARQSCGADQRGRSGSARRTGSRAMRRRLRCSRSGSRSICTRMWALRRTSPSATASSRCTARTWWGTPAWPPNRP